MLGRIAFLLHFYRDQLPHGRTPIASHTSLFTGVMPCPPVDLCPTNRLNFSSPRTGRGGAFNHRFFTPLPPRSRGKRLECEQRQRREVSRLVCWVGGSWGRFAFCVLWPGAGSRRRAAPNLIPKPGRRQFPLLAAGSR